VPALPASMPRDEVTHLATPKASLSTAGKIFRANLVVKMSVKVIIHTVNIPQFGLS